MKDFSQLRQNYIVATNERYLFIARNMWKTFWPILEAKRNTKYIGKYEVEVYLLTGNIGTKNRSYELFQ